MDIETLYGIRIYIIESLPSDRLHTGLNLMHKLQKLWTKENCYDFDVKYYEVFDKSDLDSTIAIILDDVENDNYIPIIQIDCHGHNSGMELLSEEVIPWCELMNLVRPINIESHNMLFLNMSMCFGANIISCIDPLERAPFKGVAGPIDKINEDVLEDAWFEFYENLRNCEKNGIKSIEHALPKDFKYIDQKQLFFLHFNQAELLPDLFQENVNYDLAKMTFDDAQRNKFGALCIDSAMYKKWKEEKYRQFCNNHIDHFCFEDV